MGRSMYGRTRPARRGWRQGGVRPAGSRAWGRGLRRVLVVAALGLVPACWPREAGYEARLLTEVCEGTSPLEGVQYLRFRVTGEGLTPVERFVPVDQGTAGLPPVPAGKGRVLEVRGYTELPGVGGRVVSVGRSRPFDVPESAASGRPMVQVALRRVGELVRPGQVDGACLTLAEPRAGHTATVLEDGRVLLAGGFQLDLNGVATTLSSAELFDPVTGALEPAPELGTGEGASFQPSPRAFHTATRLPGGKVLLAGGEVESAEGVLPVGNALVLDVGQRAYTSVALRSARSRHAAALESGGRVLLVGGVGAGGAVVASPEGYAPETGELFPVATRVPRVGMSVMPVQGGQRIAVVGGSDGVSLLPEVLLFAYEGGSFVSAGSGGTLREPRRDAALVPFGGPERLLVVGGHDSSGGLERWPRLLATSELLSPGESAPVAGGPQVFARSEPCAVALPDGRVMLVGGRRIDAGGPRSAAHVELLVPGKGGDAPAALGLAALARPRHQLSCTALEDGSVLLAGGLDDDGFNPATLGDLLLYMPAPLE